MCRSTSRWRSIGSSVPPRDRTRSISSPPVGPCPHKAPPDDSDTRSLARVTLARLQPSPSSPTRFSAGRRTSSRKTSLNVWAPVISMMGRIGDARQVHRAHEVGDALVLRGVGVRAGDEDAVAGVLGQRGPDLLAGHHPFVAVALGPGRQRRQVGPGAGLAEELAPHVLAGQERHEVAVLLLLRARVQQRRARPADADRVDRAPHARAPAARRRRPAGGPGSASSPHGFGQCGATRPASASWRPDGDGCSASQVRSSVRRGSSSGGSSKSTDADDRRWPGRRHRDSAALGRRGRRPCVTSGRGVDAVSGHVGGVPEWAQVDGAAFVAVADLEIGC